MAWLRGLRSRGMAFYDFENNSFNDGDDSSARTNFSSAVEDSIGSNIELRESFLGWNFKAAGIPVVVRLAQQIVSWGETSFVEGINVINPLDGTTALQPTSVVEDLRVPQKMLWARLTSPKRFP